MKPADEDGYEYLHVAKRLVNFEADVLASEVASETEYLPVTAWDGKQRLPGEYFIVNPIGSVDCLNGERSDELAQEFVLDRNKLADVPDLFRIDTAPYVCVVSERLGRVLMPLDFTNLLFHELEIVD